MQKSLSTWRWCTSIVALTMSASAAIKTPSAAPASQKESRQPLLNQYCVPCHNEKAKVAGLVLTNLNPEDPALHADTWEKVIHKVGAGEMPPPGLPRPSAEISDAFRAGLM